MQGLVSWRCLLVLLIDVSQDNLGFGLHLGLCLCVVWFENLELALISCGVTGALRPVHDFEVKLRFQEIRFLLQLIMKARLPLVCSTIDA